ncbi:uncharacterized protein LOC126740247 [Anthonomus grandis grandis]|uniref:uncharacterized protein LOC126740247 n=1 Tax=Anthonomus grandis grandis TaxID=2921223 RepID=UPI002165A568|nr:uncharacterized protein LOC126740247 [Anthonomus grandis grandis]
MAPPRQNQLLVLKQQKLKDLERSLNKIIQKLDLDINQTDVEWLNLKSLILQSKETLEKKPTQEPEGKHQQPEQRNFTSLKPLQQMDDLAVNELDMDLSLGQLVNPSIEEECDSD